MLAPVAVHADYFHQGIDILNEKNETIHFISKEI